MTERPNIVLIVTDQQRYDTIAALGFPHVETPNIDRLAAEGVSFSNCHVTAPSCVPSRASLFTGQYPHTTGILANGQRWQRTWVEMLRAGGYRCVNIGKMHTIPYESDSGFTERYVVENKDRYLEGRWYFDEWDKALAANGLVKQQREQYRQRADYRERLGAFDWELPEHLHSDAFVGNMATWWIDTHPPVEPLFLQVGFPGPHPPYDPPARYSEPYLSRVDLPLPQPSAAELASLPDTLKEKRRHDVAVDHDSVVWSLDPSPDQLRRMWAHYLGNVTLIDDKVGQLMRSLEARGYLRDAVVIFTSDHGDCMGEHGLSQKWSMYDCVTRVPAVVWSSAGRFRGGGRQVDDLCQWFDLGPTILELAGIDVPPVFEARSLLPVLEAGDWTPRPHVFCEQAGDVSLTGSGFIFAVRNRRWKLVSFRGDARGQIFDLEADPEEVCNLWDDPDHQDVRRELLEVHRDWLVASMLHTRERQVETR